MANITSTNVILLSIGSLGTHTNDYFISLIGPWEIWMKFRYVIFKHILVIDGWGISSEIVLIWMSLDFTDGSVNIGSGTGLLPSGNKPLPEPKLAQISVAIWCH